MAERRGHDRSVQFEHAFDRLLAVKLERVYEILVPEQVRANRLRSAREGE
jgi:site-specific DNA recombinase